MATDLEDLQEFRRKLRAQQRAERGLICFLPTADLTALESAFVDAVDADPDATYAELSDLLATSRPAVLAMEMRLLAQAKTLQPSSAC